MSDPGACQCRKCYLHGRDECPRVAAVKELAETYGELDRLRASCEDAVAMVHDVNRRRIHAQEERDAALAKLEKTMEALERYQAEPSDPMRICLESLANGEKNYDRLQVKYDAALAKLEKVRQECEKCAGDFSPQYRHILAIIDKEST